MGLVSALFTTTSKTDELLEKGAKIIDVRSPEEFNYGHIPGSINIPLDEINSNLDKLRNYDSPLILCCASGFRSGRAVGYLKLKGLECSNGGGWSSLNRKI
jgi:phage shock protein E